MLAMPVRLRMVLALAGLLLLILSLAALAYVFWPLDSAREQIPIAPTLFSPPASALLRGWWA